MKKIFALFTAAFFAVTLFAQTGNTLYKFTNERQADYLLKAISLNFKMTDSESAKIMEVLQGSARSQVEQYQQESGKDANMVDMIVNRQTRHIEANFEQILGADRFKEYQKALPSIQTKYNELKGSAK